MITDDPGVEDQVAIHPVYSSSSGTNEDETDFNFSLEKTLIEPLSLGIDNGYSTLKQFDGKPASGWQNVSATLKYQVVEDDPGEAIAAVGLVREFGGTGRTSVGADPFGSTTPTVYFGKGLGGFPVAALRPVTLTGSLGYRMPDKPNRDPYEVAIGLSVQYSLPYAQRHSGAALSGVAARLTPLVEYAWAKPTSHVQGSSEATGVFAPGLIWSGDTYQLGVEALISASHSSERGIIAQVHFFLEDIFPESLGKPLF